MKKSTIKQIVGFVIFAVILVALFCNLTWLFRGNGSEAREEIGGFRNQGKIDVVFYGASNLLRYYQPLTAWKEQGFTSYNYAVLSGQADSMKDYIAESRKWNEAELYVCDIRAFAMIEDEIHEAGTRNWTDSLPVFSADRWKGITSYLFSRDTEEIDVPSYYFDLLKYHTNYEALSDEAQWRGLDRRAVYNVDKGFEPTEGHIPFAKPEISETRAELNERQSAALEELLDYCDQEKLPVLFICNPIILKEKDGGVLNTIGDRITERGYTFLDCNRIYDDIGLDFETDFGDVNHVNYLGSVKYTEYLAEYIAAHYELPDHREDPAYAQWDADCEAFAERQKEWENSARTVTEEHLQSKENWDAVRSCTDFTTWFSKINSPDYSVLVLMKDIPETIAVTNPFREMTEKYGIEAGKTTLAGIWSGEEEQAVSYGEEPVDMFIGVDLGRGSWRCQISVPEELLLIGNDNYFVPGQKNQILIYDNNYEMPVDRVFVDLTEDGAGIRRQ